MTTALSLRHRDPEAWRRLHESKVRLISKGWIFEERSSGGGDSFHVTTILPGHDGQTFSRHFYSDALDAAIKFASMAQLRLENTEP